MLDDALWMDEYGTPFDLRRLPSRQFEAHMAILEGKSKEREKQQKEAERAGQG